MFNPQNHIVLDNKGQTLNLNLEYINQLSLTIQAISECVCVNIFWHTDSTNSLHFLAICPKQPSLLVNLLNCIMCPHRTDELSFCWSANTGVFTCWRTSLVSSALLLQQCPTCLAHLTWTVCKM